MTKYIGYRPFAISDAALANMAADELQANGGQGLLDWDRHGEEHLSENVLPAQVGDDRADDADDSAR